MLNARLWLGLMLSGPAGSLETLYRKARSVINLSQASFKALRETACTRAEPRAPKGKVHMLYRDGSGLVTGQKVLLSYWAGRGGGQGAWVGTLREKSMGHGGLIGTPALIPASTQEILLHRNNTELQRFCILSAAGRL